MTEPPPMTDTAKKRLAVLEKLKSVDDATKQQRCRKVSVCARVRESSLDDLGGRASARPRHRNSGSTSSAPRDRRTHSFSTSSAPHARITSPQAALAHGRRSLLAVAPQCQRRLRPCYARPMCCSTSCTSSATAPTSCNASSCASRGATPSARTRSGSRGPSAMETLSTMKLVSRAGVAASRKPLSVRFVKFKEPSKGLTRASSVP